MRKIIAFCILLSTFLITGCMKQESDSSPVIAKVGASKLSLADVQQSIPPEYSSIVSLEQYKEYVRRWADTEVLYQEALRKKLDRDPSIAQRVERAKREILVAEIINQYCSSGSTDVPESKIQQYYEEHSKEFTREQAELKALHMLIPDEKVAWSVRQKVTADNFQELARQYSIDPVDDSASISYTSAKDIMPELAVEVFKIRIGGTTPIIKASRGFYIMRILDKQASGSVRALAEVRDEIVSRLTAGRQKKQAQELINSLKQQSPVTLYFDRLPGNTDAQNNPQQTAPAATDTTMDSIP